jgi:hypothetical protein
VTIKTSCTLYWGCVHWGLNALDLLRCDLVYRGVVLDTLVERCTVHVVSEVESTVVAQRRKVTHVPDYYNLLVYLLCGTCVYMHYPGCM